MIFVDNRSSTIREIISGYLEWSERADIAVAFLRKSGVGLVDSSIKRLLRRGGIIRILVGKDFGYTEPDALLYLKSIGAHLRIFVGDIIFHPKCYIFRKSGKLKVVLGSSNFTASGFNTGVEWNLALDESEANLEKILAAFENIWESGHVRDISDDVVDEMRRHYNETRSKERDLISKLDSKFESIEFIFQVNSSFLSSQYYRPITIPVNYNQLLKKYVQSTNHSATIITPSNKRTGGRIHHSTSSWSPYYQIRSSIKGDKEVADRLEIGQNIKVKVELDEDRATVYLSEAA